MGNISYGTISWCCYTSVCLDWHIGSTFSADTLQRQQQALRRQYGLAYKPVITDPRMLETPPSERDLPGYFTNPK